MKSSLDLPDELYRQVKSRSALEGKAIREVATALFTAWIDGKVPLDEAGEPHTTTRDVPDTVQQWLAKWRALGSQVAQAPSGSAGLLEQLRSDRR